MKKQLLFTALLAISLCLTMATLSMAQTPSPDQGYWVTETNLKQKNKTTVRFYNAKHQLVHEQYIVGKRLNIKSPKTVKALNSQLHEIMSKSLLANEEKAPKPQVANNL